MQKQIAVFILAGTGLFSCRQGSSPTPRLDEQETVNSVRKYEYVDAAGGRLVVFNSLPRGGGYTGPDGQRHPYVVFYSQIMNQSTTPIEIRMETPADSFEFPHASGVYLHLFLPSDTMRADQATSMDYGLPVKRFLDSPALRPHALQRTIPANDSSAIYVVLTSNKGVGGVMRTGLRMEDGELVYKIAAYESIPGHPLLGEKDLKLGSIVLRPGPWRRL